MKWHLICLPVTKYTNAKYLIYNYNRARKDNFETPQHIKIFCILNFVLAHLFFSNSTEAVQILSYCSKSFYLLFARFTNLFLEILYFCVTLIQVWIFEKLFTILKFLFCFIISKRISMEIYEIRCFYKWIEGNSAKKKYIKSLVCWLRAKGIVVVIISIATIKCQPVIMTTLNKSYVFAID